MGTIKFCGDPRFELILQSPQEAEDDSVEVTLPIFFAGDPGHTREVLLKLNAKRAEDLAKELMIAVEAARS
jgi:hypothetical protein